MIGAFAVRVCADADASANLSECSILGTREIETADSHLPRAMIDFATAMLAHGTRAIGLPDPQIGALQPIVRGVRLKRRRLRGSQSRD